MSWSWGPANSRIVRVLLYAKYGVFRGGAFLLLVGGSYLLTQRLFSGDSNPRSLLLLLIVGWFLAYIGVINWAGRTTLRQTRLYDEFYRVSHPRWYATGTLFGAGSHYLLFTYSPTVWAIAFLSSVPVLIIGSHLFSSEGEFDWKTQTLTYQGEEIDLALVTGIRRVTVGKRTILWLSFTRGRVGMQTPRLLVLPTRLVNSAWSVFETGSAHEVESAKPDRGTQAVFFGAALGFLGIAVVIGVLLTQNEGLVVALGLSGVFAVFGLLFLWLAIFDV